MIENILPHELEEKYDCVKIADRYVAYWYVKEYIGGVKVLSSLDMLLASPNIQLYFKVKKKNSGEFLKKVNNRLAVSKSEKSKSGVEQIDIDILNKLVDEARKLRYAVQVESEDVFEVGLVVAISCDSHELLKKETNRIKNIAYSNGLSLYPLTFKQLQAYSESLPVLNGTGDIFNTICKVFTTSSLTSLFPFYTESLTEKDGVCIGKFKNRFCMLDLMKKEANNNNILIVGSSGAGKSYLVKNIVLQYLYKGKKQVVLDPEKEYVDMANVLEQRVISLKDFNIMEIEESFVQTFPTDFLDRKIDMIYLTLELDKVAYLADKEKEIKEEIKKIYMDSGITQDASSLYRNDNELNVYASKKYIKKSKFPVIAKLKEYVSCMKLKKSEKDETLSKIKQFECELIQDTSEDLIVFDLENCDEKYIMAVMYKLTEYFSSQCAIYIDEMWKQMKSDLVADKIANMFKTIRKRGASIIGITQDITDIVSYRNGDFGKSIFNNAYTKIFFKMEYLDIENIQKIVFKTKEFYEKVTSLKRGSALIEQGGMFLDLDIVAFPQERQLILGGSL